MIPTTTLGRPPPELIGGWEVGLLVLMALLYLGGAFVNPGFFGSIDAFHALLRDAARYGVMAVGMTFVIVNKDLDLSVGSIYGLITVVFSMAFSPAFYDLGPGSAVLICLVLGLGIGLVNGVLVTILRVPAFIATLTMLLIGRGIVLGLTGGNEQAAVYAGIPTNWVRIRGYLLSALCATIAGLMAVAQDKGTTSQAGLGAELIVIASVIIGGASILGGRGRVVGSCLGAVLTVLIDKVLREGVPITRTIVVNNVEIQVNAVSSLPVGAVPVFLGLLLLVAVLIEPHVVRRRVPARIWAWLRGRPPPPLIEIGGVALEGAQTKGSSSDRALGARGFGKFLARRDALAIILTVVLWLVGLYLRPDYWWNLPNSFAILLNYTELALLTVGLTYVIACGDIDLSVGAVLAFAGGTAAYFLKVLGADPITAVMMGMLAGTLAGAVNALIAVGFGLPAFIATLGMFYIARGLAAWLVAGQQLTGWSESFNLLGRKVGDILGHLHLAAPPGLLRALTDVVSVQTVWLVVVAAIAGIVLGYTTFGQQVYATGGNRRAADYAGISTRRVRATALLLSGLCASMAGIINVAFFRSFNPVAGQFRELDAIASVIIGGGSIFGGYGTIIGSLAGAAVITLVRALLQLNIITADGRSLVLPQHWVNAFIGVILVMAVLIDIWIRQANIFGRLREALSRRQTISREAAHS